MIDTMNTNQPLVDALLDHYLSWREECAALDAAYRRWTIADEADRPLAFTAYRAQLEMEEHAAACYQHSAIAAMAEMEGRSPTELEPRRGLRAAAA